LFLLRLVATSAKGRYFDGRAALNVQCAEPPRQLIYNSIIFVNLISRH